jgi:hypothetical protein
MEINLDPRSKGKELEIGKAEPQTPTKPPKRRRLVWPQAETEEKRAKSAKSKGRVETEEFLVSKESHHRDREKREQRCCRRRRLADGERKQRRPLWEGEKKAITTAPAGLNREPETGQDGRALRPAGRGRAGPHGFATREGPRGTRAAHEKIIKSPHAPAAIRLIFLSLDPVTRNKRSGTKSALDRCSSLQGGRGQERTRGGRREHSHC